MYVVALPHYIKMMLELHLKQHSFILSNGLTCECGAGEYSHHFNVVFTLNAWVSMKHLLHVPICIA